MQVVLSDLHGGSLGSGSSRPNVTGLAQSIHNNLKVRRRFLRLWRLNPLSTLGQPAFGRRVSSGVDYG